MNKAQISFLEGYMDPKHFVLWKEKGMSKNFLQGYMNPEHYKLLIEKGRKIK